MPDTKLADLTAGTAEATDIVYAVKDPGGTPLDRKITLSSVKDYVTGSQNTFTGSQTISSGSLILSGNISAPAWTTSGIRQRGVAATLTDTTSTGTVAAAYTNVYGGNTIAASNATTFTDYFTSYINAPTAGANVTFTRNWALGLGGALQVNGGTLNGTVLDVSQTWGGTGTYTGLRYNVTDSGPSNAGSLLMDLQVGGSSRFSVSKAGTVTVPQSSIGGFSIGSTASTYISFWSGSGVGTSLVGGSAQLHVKNANVAISNAQIAFEATANIGNTSDLFLGRRAAANLRLGAADVGATTSTVTITIAAPGVVTWTGHGLSTGTPVVFTTTGALPTGITAGTTYYAVVVDANTFQIASSVANAIAATPTVITTSGTQSGTHTGTRYNITQRLGMQSNTGVTDRLGADLIIQGSQGTGTGAGGSIIFQVAPAGTTGTAQNALVDALTITSTRQIVLGGTGATTASITGSAGSTSGIGFNSGEVVIVRSGNIHSIFNSTGLDVNLANARVAVPNSGYFVVGDAYLYRDAANTLALRNGANAQTFNVYNTFTSSTNFERYSVDWITTSNLVIVGPNKGSGGGTQRVQRLAYLEDGGTGSTTPSLGTTCPAASATIKSWIKVITSDGSTGYIPCWA